MAVQTPAFLLRIGQGPEAQLQRGRLQGPYDLLTHQLIDGPGRQPEATPLAGRADMGHARILRILAVRIVNLHAPAAAAADEQSRQQGLASSGHSRTAAASLILPDAFL